MSDETVADEYNVETVHRVKGSQVIHLTDDCSGIKTATNPLESDATSVPAGYYQLCEYCDPTVDAPSDGQSKQEGWPV